MSCVQKGWDASNPGRYFDVVTPSDEAFGLFLLRHYRDIPPSAVIRREQPREGRRQRLDGRALDNAMEEYGMWKNNLKTLRQEKPRRRQGNALLEINSEIVTYVLGDNPVVERQEPLQEEDRTVTRMAVDEFLDDDFDTVVNRYEA